MIINGLPGHSKETKDAWQTFVTLCVDDLELGEDWVREAGIAEVYRFPSKKKTDLWPLFVRFGSTRPKDDMFKAAPKLKGKGYSLRHDLAPHLVAERNDLIKTSVRIRKEPHNLLTKLRESPFRVWLVFRKNASDDWETWEDEV